MVANSFVYISMCASKKMMGGSAFAFINHVSLGLRVHYNMKDMECLDGCVVALQNAAQAIFVVQIML